MLFKIATLLIVVVAVLAMLGKLRLLLPKTGLLGRGKCPACGRHRIGTGPCPCGKA